MQVITALKISNPLNTINHTKLPPKFQDYISTIFKISFGQQTQTLYARLTIKCNLLPPPEPLISHRCQSGSHATWLYQRQRDVFILYLSCSQLSLLQLELSLIYRDTPYMQFNPSINNSGQGSCNVLIYNYQDLYLRSIYHFSV